MGRPIELFTEKRVGNVAVNDANLFLRDTLDMEELEFWEQRLEDLGVPYVIVYRKKQDKNFYRIYTKKTEQFR